MRPISDFSFSAFVGSGSWGILSTYGQFCRANFENSRPAQAFWDSARWRFRLRVQGEERPDSDVDVLIDFEPGKANLNNLCDVADALENVFHRKVDLVTPGSLSKYIGPYILESVKYVEIN